MDALWKETDANYEQIKINVKKMSAQKKSFEGSKCVIQHSFKLRFLVMNLVVSIYCISHNIYFC